MDRNRLNRRSIRLKGYDYTHPGAYFVTLVAHERKQFFSEVINGRIELSALGIIILDEWMKSIGIRREIKLYEDEIVIMPNHVHGIVRIIDVGADGIRPNMGILPTDLGAHRAPLPKQQNEPQFKRTPRSLGSFLAGFKASVSSRAARELGVEHVWQSNYYDHIIRNENEFGAIWNYIDTNPLHWESDELYSGMK